MFCPCFIFLEDRLSQRLPDRPYTKYATVAVDERSEVSFSINRGTLAWQPIFVGFVGFYPYNGVSVLFARWLRTTRSASAALDAGEPIN